ncbi:MAG: thiamine phosphate synthase [Candidatus Sumerlaeia bacterium]
MSALKNQRLRRFRNARLYAITDQAMTGGLGLGEIARRVFAGGCRLLQLRAKTTPFEELLAVGRAMTALAREYEALLIVNDNPYLAREIGADGLHIGQNDVSVEIARDIVGSDLLIGLSTHNAEQVLRAQSQPLDYIAIGPVFATSSKPDADPPLGVDAVRWVVAHSRHPVVAIGGITGENISDVVQTGVDAVAVISALMSASDLTRATTELLEQIRNAKKPA